MNDDPRIVRLRSLGAQIGMRVFLGHDVYIEHDFAPLLTIEDDVVLARGVSIILHDSALNNITGAPLKFGRVVLRKKCYIGVNSTILCGVEIGEQALIGACSLVTHSVPAGMVAYGHPARIQGSVEEFAKKQVSTDGRWHYLDLPAWRDRQQQVDPQEDVIRAFVEYAATQPLPTEPHQKS